MIWLIDKVSNSKLIKMIKLTNGPYSRGIIYKMVIRWAVTLRFALVLEYTIYLVLASSHFRTRCGIAKMTFPHLAGTRKVCS